MLKYAVMLVNLTLPLDKEFKGTKSHFAQKTVINFRNMSGCAVDTMSTYWIVAKKDLY